MSARGFSVAVDERLARAFWCGVMKWGKDRYSTVDFSLTLLLAAFGGSLSGAAVGGQPAFIFTGFMVMIGVASSLAGGGVDFLTNVAFGPVFGPHIAFASGAAAGRVLLQVVLDPWRDPCGPSGVRDLYDGDGGGADTPARRRSLVHPNRAPTGEVPAR